jgi:hypothetical protein
MKCVIALNFTERYAQARLYAAQVRVRRGMGDSYAHSKANHLRRERAAAYSIKSRETEDA